MLANSVAIALLTIASLFQFTFASSTSFNSNNDATCTLGGRTYRLHKPASYLSETSHALVLSLHGRNGSPKTQETLSR